MLEPGYEDSMANMSQAVSGASDTPGGFQNINYNLNVNISGLEDVGNQVAQTAAKKIIERLPGNNNYKVSYGS